MLHKCSEEVFKVVHSHCTSRQRSKVHPCIIDAWHCKTMRALRSFLPRRTIPHLAGSNLPPVPPKFFKKRVNRAFEGWQRFDWSFAYVYFYFCLLFIFYLLHYIKISNLKHKWVIQNKKKTRQNIKQKHQLFTWTRTQRITKIWRFQIIDINWSLGNRFLDYI